MSLTLRALRLVGALATGALVADVSYVQFVPQPNATTTTCADRDLFDATIVEAPWASTVRIATLVVGTLATAAVVLDTLCPATTHYARRRVAGSLVTSTTSTL